MDGEETRIGLEDPKGEKAEPEGSERVGSADPRAGAGSAGSDSAGHTASQAGPQAPTVNVVVGERKAEESRAQAPTFAPRHKRTAFQVIDFIFWVGSALLLLRFALKLVAANPGNGFVTFI